MARIIAVASQKGGVGKTTTTLALGAALAQRGQRVLLVDFDPQASLTTAAGLKPDSAQRSISDAISRYLDGEGAEDGVAPSLAAYARSIAPLLDVIPSTIDLAAVEPRLHRLETRPEYVLSDVLSPAQDAYDVVLIDCSPSLSVLTTNALTVADEVIIPIPPEYLAMRGLRLLLDTIQNVRRSGLNPRLTTAGLVMTMVDYRTRMGRTIAESIHAHVGATIPVLGEVKRSAKVQEAMAAALPITAYAPHSESAQAYVRIADALIASWDKHDTPPR